MSTYSIPELLQKWARSEVTADQVIGYLLQNWANLQQKLADLEKRLRQLEQSLKP